MLMSKEIKILTSNHLKTKRNYLKRMMNSKVKCMNEAKKYEYNYWDGSRKFGYGGYKYIEGRWTNVAKKFIKIFKLKNSSKILDIGCGKAFLLFEIKKILPKIEISGFDISKHAIKNTPKSIRKYIFNHKAQKKYPFKAKNFDLAISAGCFHNLEINELKFALNEIQRVSKKSYVMVESYRNNKELFNLQCWALTCESFFSKNEWQWLFREYSYKGYYEFIYFN